MMLRLLKHFMALSMLITAGLSHAELTIDILKANNNAMPIAVVPFGSDTATEPLNRIISDDLARSGLFKPADKFPEKPSNSTDINYGVWQAINLDYVVVGTVTPQANNQLTIQYELLSSNQQQRLLGESMTIPPARWRDAGPGLHRAPDQTAWRPHAHSRCSR